MVGIVIEVEVEGQEKEEEEEGDEDEDEEGDEYEEEKEGKEVAHTRSFTRQQQYLLFLLFYSISMISQKF